MRLFFRTGIIEDVEDEAVVCVTRYVEGHELAADEDLETTALDAISANPPVIGQAGATLAQVEGHRDRISSRLELDVYSEKEVQLAGTGVENTADGPFVTRAATKGIELFGHRAAVLTSGIKFDIEGVRCGREVGGLDGWSTPELSGETTTPDIFCEGQD